MGTELGAAVEFLAALRLGRAQMISIKVTGNILKLHLAVNENPVPRRGLQPCKVLAREAVEDTTVMKALLVVCQD